MSFTQPAGQCVQMTVGCGLSNYSMNYAEVVQQTNWFFFFPLKFDL